MVHFPLPCLSTGGYNRFFSGRIPARCFTATQYSNLACLSSPEKSCEASTSKPYPLLPLVGGINYEKMGAVCCWDHTMLLHWCCLFSFLSNYHSAVGIAECIQHPLSKRLVTDDRLTIFLEVLLSQPLQSGRVYAAIGHPGCRRYVLIRPGAMAPQLGPHQWWRDEHRQLLSQPEKCPLGLHGFATLDRSTALKGLDPHLAQRWLVAVHSVDLVLQHVPDLGATWIQLTFLIQAKIIVIWKTCRFHACEMHLFFDNLVTWTCLVIGPTYLLATFRIPGIYI